MAGTGSPNGARRPSSWKLHGAADAPSPVADLRHVLAVAGDVLLVFAEFLADGLLGVSRRAGPGPARGR